MFGKHKIPLNHVLEIEEQLRALEADPRYALDINEMRENLGGHFSDYQDELKNLERSIPKDCLGDIGRKYADDAEEFLKRVTRALNLKHIVVNGDGTKAQKELLQRYMDEASALHDRYESNFVFDETVHQPGLSDAMFLHSYHDISEDHSRPYNQAYAVLEGYPVYIALRPEDFQPNDQANKNSVQQRWLRIVLDDNSPEPQAEREKSELMEKFRLKGYHL